MRIIFFHFSGTLIRPLNKEITLMLTCCYVINTNEGAAGDNQPGIRWHFGTSPNN